LFDTRMLKTMRRHHLAEGTWRSRDDHRGRGSTPWAARPPGKCREQAGARDPRRSLHRRVPGSSPSASGRARRGAEFARGPPLHTRFPPALGIEAHRAASRRPPASGSRSRAGSSVRDPRSLGTTHQGLSPAVGRRIGERVEQRPLGVSGTAIERKLWVERETIRSLEPAPAVLEGGGLLAAARAHPEPADGNRSPGTIDVDDQLALHA